MVNENIEELLHVNIYNEVCLSFKTPNPLETGMSVYVQKQAYGRIDIKPR